MKILVIGGTGTVGSQVVRELPARNMDVQVLTCSADKAKSLSAGARGVTGDLLDPGTVRSVFRGIDGVFMLLALALATTVTGAMHAQLAHGQPLRVLAPKILVGAPLAYGVMRLVHMLLGT